MQPKYVFIASGIGITPFRSIITELIESGKKEKILLFYIANNQEFIFHELFSKAETQVGLQTIYLDKQQDFTELLIRQTIKDPRIAMYYVSGPQYVVESYRDMLMKLGIESTNIKTDLFSGYEEDTMNRL